MQRILITGGAGFIGSNIANHIADKEEYRAVICDVFGKTDKWKNVAKHPIFEIINPEDTFFWLESNADKLKAVVHMGAISSTTETDVDLFLHNNFSFSKQLWSWCAENDKPFVYASSAATYGDGNQGFDDEIKSSYLNSLRPMNAYGWSKHLFDQYVSTSVARGDKCPKQWVGLKFFNVYGPNEDHKDSQKSVAAQIFPHAAAGVPVKLFKSENPDYADGGQKRDFVYVKDCVHVVEWLINNPNVSGLYNVGTGEARTFEDVANAVFAALGKDPNISYIEMPNKIKEKYQYFTQANMKRLIDAGYDKPFTSIEDGIGDYVKRFLSQSDQYY